MDPREIAIAAFYADSHPLVDKYVVEVLGVDPVNGGYGLDLAELIAFAGLLPPEDLVSYANG